jgi:uroporphyrinogen decarboxylase
MTPKEKFIMALEGKKPQGRVPHFELAFFLTMEAFGRVHPLHRKFDQWGQMSESERKLHMKDIADVYVITAEKYEHSAIFMHSSDILDGQVSGMTLGVLEGIRQISGDKFFLMTHGDVTYGVPTGSTMMDVISELADNPQSVKDKAKKNVESALETSWRFKKYGLLDGVALCSDYCFNDMPFLSPAMFDEFVTPYLTDLIAGYREMGFYVIKHTDGNIMPILDSLISANPHALHSLDPQGGVDIAEVKRLVGDKVCLIGNVNCGLIDTGTDEQIIESARYALKHGMPGGGYIFSTSNCVYTGMNIDKYELILDVWRECGNY